MSQSKQKQQELAQLRRQARQAELRAQRIMRRSAGRIDWTAKENRKYNPLAGMGTNWQRQNSRQLQRSIEKLNAFTVRGMVVTQDKKIVPKKLVEEYRRERRRYREKQRRMARKVGEYKPKQLGGQPVKSQPKGVYGKFVGKDIVAKPGQLQNAGQLKRYTEKLSTQHEENIKKARKDIIDLVNGAHKSGPRYDQIKARIRNADPERVAMLRGDTGFMDLLHDWYMNLIDDSEFEQALAEYGL